MKLTVLLVPAAVVTLTVLVVAAAPIEITKFAVTVVEFTTVMELTAMPVPEGFTAVVPVRLVPVSVTRTVVPRVPDVGEIEDSVGPLTVNVTALVVPFGVATVTFLAPSVA
ncbi:MAG TPA: hypothetical protein VG498_05360, partial [Terriglobales bacterium]|nr:hypothetical protein [Terriglobales bacterium]